ncbi:aldo/keto reductase [Desulfosoma caldarium]|uniref:Putative aldo/keto reductase-like oxidoreductase n=1 Tax=Desulfosoma caldarium TaxID=610254 RepID=A0A3N1VJG6_9BACT|nr:aldo/keto reductase [Desulfosoma caldarium]ROR02956.1 putative aldo/keto reductase-like oxidoreductase [Desulfosoma caldarium]
MPMDSLDLVDFGQTGCRVSRVGLGGEGVLRTRHRLDEAVSVIETALHEGISYFDSAPAYADSEDYYGAVWKKHPQRREGIFQASKSAQRTRDGALRDLERTFHRMGLSRLDLWQIHDVRSMEELHTLEKPGGALHAFLEAKASGLAAHIGVTGHHDPRVLTEAVARWPLDAVLLPVNPVEAILGGFLNETASVAAQKGMAVIGMKVLGGSQYLAPNAGIDAVTLIRFALSQPVTLVVVGCHSAHHVRTLASCARPFQPMDREEQSAVLDVFRPYAKRLAFYRGPLG